MSWLETVVIGERPGPEYQVGNLSPLVFFAGVNVIESKSLVFEVAESMVETCRRHSVPLVFKASWDKANRSSIDSFRGPGLEEGLRVLAEVREAFQVPIVTDVHSVEQVERVAEVADVIQIPAFLCRQTDLLRAASETGRPILIKKMQMMAPESIRHILEKCARFGSQQLMVCERGTSFGYNNLVVDPLSFPKLKLLSVPVVFDVTHALQTPGGGATTMGQGQFTESLAMAGVSQGIAALFIECHPRPIDARCDGPSALPLADFERVVERALRMDRLVKSWA